MAKVIADVGIIIAKDHESDNFLKALSALRIDVSPVASDNPTVILKRFEIKDGNSALSCLVTYMNGQGSKIVDFTTSFLQLVDIKYLLTVGICGGRKENVKKVMFFDEAWILEETPPKRANPSTAQYGSVELWRNLGLQFDLVKPDDAHVILTVPKIEGEVEATFDDFNKNALPELAKRYNIDISEAQGLDMEIGYIFDALTKYNYLVQYSGNPGIKTLHAIKAVSDSGGDEERRANKPEAMRCAANAAVLYLGFLLSAKLIVPRPTPQVQPPQVVQAPAPNNNNVAYLISQLAFTICKSVATNWRAVATLCGWENTAQLSDHMGAGNELAALIILLYKKDGSNGLKKFREELERLKENSALEEINKSASAALFY